MISDSANTVQVEVIRTASGADRAVGPKSSSDTPRRAAVCSRKRPVPAAHLSFIAKSMGAPFGPMRITLLSWPPMSTSVPAIPVSAKTPRAWQVISVTARSASGTSLRP